LTDTDGADILIQIEEKQLHEGRAPDAAVVPGSFVRTFTRPPTAALNHRGSPREGARR